MAQAQASPQNDSGIPMSPMQKYATKQWEGQSVPGEAASKPFGWLIDMISHITGQGQPQQPGQPGQPAQAGQPAQPAAAGAKGKQSSAQPGAGGAAGAIDPSQVPALQSVMAPGAEAAASMGLLPQTQGSFQWLLEQLQTQQLKQQSAQQGGSLVDLVSSLGGSGSPMLDLSSGAGSAKAPSAAPAKAAGKG